LVLLKQIRGERDGWIFSCESFFIFASKTQIAIPLTNTIAEPELIARLIKKDQSALDYLYDHYSGALYGVVFRILKKEETAEEVLQDIFLRVWDKIESYDPSKGKLFTWMINIARNQAIDKTRSKEVSKGRKTDDIDYLVNKIDMQEHSQLAVDAIGLKEVLLKLSEDQRFIVNQLYLKGYTQSEVAEEFDIPLGTVKTRLRLAMIELRSILDIK
jgi:RNA polymerase sigma factor (sigma-70 family)